MEEENCERKGAGGSPIVYQHFRGKPFEEKNNLSTPNQDSNPDLSVINSPVTRFGGRVTTFRINFRFPLAMLMRVFTGLVKWGLRREEYIIGTVLTSPDDYLGNTPRHGPVTTAPLPAVRRRRLLPQEEPELETPVPTQQPKPAKRAGKHLRKIYPTVEEEQEENPKPVERIVAKVQPQVKDPVLKTSPAVQYLIDRNCLDEIQESSDQKLKVNSVQKVIKIAQEYQELKSKAVGIQNVPSPDKDIEVVVNNIPKLSPVIKVPDSPKCSIESDTTEVTDTKVLDTTKDNSKPSAFVPFARANTLTSCTSGDYSEYSWYDAKSDKTYEFMDCGSGFYETVEVVSGSAIGENGGESRGSKDTIVPEDSDEDSADSDVHIERMNHVNNQSTKRYQDEGLAEDTTPVADTVYLDQVRRRVKSGSYINGEPTSPTSSTSRKEKTSSGFFSFLRWFRKNKDGDDESEDVANREFEEGLSFPTAPSTPELLRSHSSSCGSVDTLFSTATATSFAFITPTCYRPFGGSNQPEKIIAVGPDTDTYRNRLRHRDRVRELDRNLTLRKKYRLFGSNTLLRSAPNTPNASPVLEKRSEVLRNNSESNDKLQPKQPNTSPGSQNSSFGKKKRKAPIPPAHPLSKLCDSLPNTLENKCKAKRKSMENDDASSLKRLYHRRTASESSKDKKSGAYCHVKGKRKAPPPPITFEQQNGISTLEKLQHQFSSIGKKKRPAPRPPIIEGHIKQEITVSKKESKEIQTINKEGDNKSLTGKLSSEEKERLIANIAKLKAHAERKSISASPPPSPSSMDLGLKSQYEQVVCNDSLKLERGVLKSNKDVPKMEIGAAENKVAPVSPRPWYKRNFTGRDSGGGGIKRDIFKSLEKKKDKSKEEDWIPEGGIPRVVGTSVPNDGGSIGSSRFSFFSRLDRSDEKKKEDKRKSQVSMLANISELDREAAEIVQKEQAREQAMLAAQNAKFYSYPDEPRLKKLPIDDVDLALPVSSNVEVPKRSSARELISLFNSIGNVTKGIPTSNGTASGVVIEEIDDEPENASKTRAMYEANKLRRHHSPSPSIPTIAEQSETASSAASTVKTNPDKGNEKLALNKLPFDENASAKANVKPGLNKLPLDENEQQKLREILKEMKNSLPKRPKKLVDKSDSMHIETIETKVTVPCKIKENVKEEKSQKLGAIKKVPKKTYEDIKSASNQKDSPASGVIKDKVPFQNGIVNEKAEALLITRKTVIEDIKVKKSGPQKTGKVSTSVQTNAVVRKVDSSQYSDQKKEGEFLSPTISAKNMLQISPDILPVTVEEYSTAIKDGVLYTSLSKDSKKIGTGTFELIRARDFANIEATKTGNEANVVHVYANITNPLIESSSPFQQSVVTSKQTPVIQIPQSVATGEKGLSADKAEVKLIQAIESSHGKVSKGSPRPSSSSGITSPELSSTRDARGSSIQSSRVSESSSCSMASASSGDNSEVEKLTAQLTLPKGLADFKANLEAEQKVEHNMNTLAINRLLRRLEAAIAGGQHMLAAGLAKDLARLKISCSVTRHRRSLDTSPASITVDMYVEDKVSHQGPIPLQVTPVLTVAQLKDKVEQEFEIPAGVQRWILGKLLASDDSKTLADHSISSGGCPIFLYLVAPDGDHEGEVTTAADPHPDPGSVTKQELVSKVESKDTPPGAKPGGGWYYNDDDERYSFCEDTESELSEGEDIPQPAKQNPIIPGTATVAQLQQVTKVIKGQKEEEDSEELDDEDEEDSIEEETIPVVVVNDKPKVLVGPLSPTVPKFPLPGPSRQLSLVEQPDKPATSQTSMKSPTPATSQTAVVLKPVTNQSPKPFRPARREAKVEKQSAVAQAPVDKHLAQPAKPAAPPEQPTGTLKLVNSPTRPGCAACTTERPLKYVVPVEYRANDQELQRMQQEQQFDNELKQACWDIFKQ
uniref:Ubiquitin-like domain-containing protein n=1 Tax=Timema bartmani TaxID=61472 RepID=A0A7R9EM44_9NEOP|nr:unnamed protein product [Timema bartmani]